MSFGSTIKQLRKEKGYTQDQLANLLNVTPQAISRWENNSAMPDISLLIPIANVFSVSTDTLLEVDVEKNREHINDFVRNALVFSSPYGTTTGEKLTIYREEIRKHPDSVELREALFSILARHMAKSALFKDSSIIREMVSLSEDIIEMGGPVNYKSMLAFFSQDLDNPELASLIVKDAPPIMYSKEILLPTSLRGRNRVEAQKKLIYKCAELIRSTAFDMYEHHEITEEEKLALSNAENIFSYLYSDVFACHFGNVTPLYIGMKAAIEKGNQSEALQRLDDMVSRLESLEKESVNIPILVPEYEVELYYTSSLALFSIKNQAKSLLENVRKIFPAGLTHKDIEIRLDRLCESNGGKLREDCINYIINLAKKLQGDNYHDPMLEDQ